MADFAKLVIEVDSKGVPKAGARLMKLTGTTKKAERATSKLAAAWKSYSNLITGAAVVLGIRSIIQAAAEQEQTLAQLRAGLESTAGASGQTMESLTALSAEMQRLTVFSNETVEAAEGILLSFTRISGEAFPRTIKAAANVATRMGTDLRSAVVQLGKALNDPVQNLGALSRSGIQFTKEQKKLIKEMWETNRAAEAQKIILDELDVQYAKSAKGAKETLGGAIKGLKNEWDDFKKALGEGIAPAAKPTLRFFSELLKAPAEMMKNYTTILVNYGLTTEQIQKQILADVWSRQKRAKQQQEDLWTTAADEEVAARLAAVRKMRSADADRLAAIRKAYEIEAGIRKTGRELTYDQDTEFLRRRLSQLDSGSEEFARVEKLYGDRTEREGNIRAARRKAEDDKRFREHLELLQKRGEAEKEAAEAAAAEAEAAAAAAAAAADAFIEEARAAQDASTEAARALGHEMQQLTLTFGTSLIDTLFDAEARSKMTFGNIADDFARMVARMMAQQALLAAVGLPSMFGPGRVASTEGNVFSHGRVMPMARGGVVTEPTLFPMQRGAGLMGEAGPEAVMPLTRTSSGELGVRAEGAGAEVNVNIINNTGARVTQRRRQSGRGVEVDVMIGESVDRQVKDGRFDRSMRSAFGLTRRGGR